MASNLRIHITPVGFEFRRATEPLIRMQADKVYLITYRPDDAAKKFYLSVKKELAQNYKHIKVDEIFVDIWDLYECLEKYRAVVTKEHENGNHLYINVSTGTKVTAMAGMLACMLWGASPYYARVSYPSTKASESSLPTEHVQEPDTLPVFEVKRPKSEQLVVLGMLGDNSGGMRKARIIEGLESAGVIRLKDETKTEFTPAAKHSQLRAILDPMETEWGFIKVETSGRRSEVFLTEKGKTALRIFGVSP